MSLALRLGTFLSPVQDGIAGNDVVIVQHFEDVWKYFQEPGIFVAVDLDRVDQSQFALWVRAERLQDWAERLKRDKRGQQRDPLSGPDDLLRAHLDLLHCLLFDLI